MLGVALRALHFLLLPARLAVHVEERRFPALYADYTEYLATGWALHEVLPHLGFAGRTPDVDRGLLPTEWAYNVLGSDEFGAVPAGPLEAGRVSTVPLLGS